MYFEELVQKVNMVFACVFGLLAICIVAMATCWFFQKYLPLVERIMEIMATRAGG